MSVNKKERNQEVWKETIHKRNSPSKVNIKMAFKGMIVTTIIASAILAYPVSAAAAPVMDNFNISNIVTETYMQEEYFGASLDTIIRETNKTISFIEDNIKKGNIDENNFKRLLTQLIVMEEKTQESMSESEKSDLKITIKGIENIMENSNSKYESKIADYVDILKDRVGITVEMKQAKAAVKYELKSFEDVTPTGDTKWCYEAVMEMAKRGMVSGTVSPDANGVGKFNPNGPMTRAQFITIVTRYLYNDDVNAKKAEFEKTPASEAWYEANYQVAVEKGLITTKEFIHNGSKNDPINKPMPRQEMAMILVRAAEAKGENMTNKITVETIADYETIAPQYREYVRSAYKAGLIAGTDKGTFAPHDTLTRAQASMVLYRLLVPESRTPGVDKVVIETPTTPTTTPDYKQPEVDSSIEQVAGHQTWREGEPHAAPKVGDTVIKADGTKVVLKETTLPNGRKILGLYQGVDIATGVRGKTGVTLRPGDTGWNDLSVLIKDDKTGECYTRVEWAAISKTVGTQLNQTTKGKYDGEIRNNWWYWDAEDSMWYWVGAKY